MSQKHTAFQIKVWNACKKIPKGRVSTYKSIARLINSRGYRAVGGALNKNTYAPHVPCHRVVASDGSLGGYEGGLKKKILLLKKEGVKVKGKKIVDFEKKVWKR